MKSPWKFFPLKCEHEKKIVRSKPAVSPNPNKVQLLDLGITKLGRKKAVSETQKAQIVALQSCMTKKIIKAVDINQNQCQQVRNTSCNQQILNVWLI